MSRFANAVHTLLKEIDRHEITSKELWLALSAKYPDLTQVRSDRKTPRTTMMRDLRKDARFLVANRLIRLK